MIKVAGIQFACSDDKERNVDKALKMAKIAVEKGAHLICFQELFNTSWFPREMNPKNFELAEHVNGPTIEKFKSLAKDEGVALICPIFEAEEEKVFYNSAVVIDAGGDLLGVYRKAHVPQIPLWEEKYYFAPGNTGFPVF